MKLILIALPLAVIGAAILACSESTQGNPVVTATMVPGSDSQSAMVGTTLPRSLQLQVRSDGVALPGTVVVWEPSSGGLTITSNATDYNGVASARWTLGSAPGPTTVTATVEGAQGSPVIFHATALGWVTAVIEPATNNQTGPVGESLPRELRLQAFAAGAPAAGVAVTWSTSGGIVNPRLSLTDAAGRASTTWTMAQAPGAYQAQAVLDRTTGAPTVFRATAHPGPTVTVDTYLGDGQSIPATFPEFGFLAVRAMDRFNNDALSPMFTWSVEHGPVAILPPNSGSVARVVPTGEVGDAVVRASLVGTSLFAEFSLVVTPAVPTVTYDGRFVSVQNGSTPAVDTIPAGATMTWVLVGPCDYCQGDIAVTSVGSPSFQGGGLDGPQPLRFTAQFDTPGTYSYTGAYGQGATGTLVVQ